MRLFSVSKTSRGRLTVWISSLGDAVFQCGKLNKKKLCQDIRIAPFRELSELISKALRVARVNEGSHGYTCHPRAHPRME